MDRKETQKKEKKSIVTQKRPRGKGKYPSMDNTKIGIEIGDSYRKSLRSVVFVIFMPHNFIVTTVNSFCCVEM
jgi:hypothetical protein